MKLRSVPVSGQVFEMGADDLLFDSLLLAGPILILLMVLGGRHPTIVALVSVYLLVFLSNICANFLRAE